MFDLGIYRLKAECLGWRGGGGGGRGHTLKVPAVGFRKLIRFGIWGLAFVGQCIFHVTVDVNLGEQKLSSHCSQ